MRKALTFLTASLALTWVAGAKAQTAPDMFQDVDPTHWAYEAMENLRAQNIVIGYPDGWFRGRRTMTRYEFAVALDRALRSLPDPQAATGVPGPAGPVGPAGPAGPRGEKGDRGDPGVGPEELEQLRRLAREFRDELASLGTSVSAANARIDRLARDVEQLKATVDAMPRITGGAWVGIRADRAAGNYIDRDGRRFEGGVPLLREPSVLHLFSLGIDAKIPGGATLLARLTTDNYLSSLGGTTSMVTDWGDAKRPDSTTYIDRLEIATPFAGVGQDSRLTIGRFAHRTTPLVLTRPDVDSYFHVPWIDDGMYRMDGLRLDGRFGSVGVEVFAGATRTVKTINGEFGFNSPLAGISAPPAVLGGKPTGLCALSGAPTVPGAMMVDQMIGASVRLPIRMMEGGHIRASALAMNSEYGGGGAFGPEFTNVLVVGSDVGLKLSERLSLDGEWAKSLTGRRRFDTVNAEMNNAFLATLGYTTERLSFSAGYKYIDPLYYAPGSWDKIGNWFNPVNIQGPTFRAKFDMSENFGMHVGGSFLWGARTVNAAAMTPSDQVNRILAGFRWNLARNFQTTLDWEGVYWALDMAAGGREGTGRVHPTEHYFTIGTGYNLTENTRLKLGYQVGDVNGKGLIGPRFNFSAITTQVSVKF
ncbi:MAG TPA: S-layer homology domain-containing protein [Chthonomonadales bacterium]|nr:S-layer homology domain-containing protein [Chthonomonadales bacterium]